MDSNSGTRANGICWHLLRNYWSADQIVGHWFRIIMRRDCFMEILCYFHIVDNICVYDCHEDHITD